MKEVETKVVVKGLRQCVSDSQVLKDNLPLYGGYTQKYGGYTNPDFGFVVYNATEDYVYYIGTWKGCFITPDKVSYDKAPDMFRRVIVEPITMKEVREFVQACRDSRK